MILDATLFFHQLKNSPIMKVRMKLIFGVLMACILFSSCQQDNNLILPADEFATEQNEIYPESHRSCGLEEKMLSLMQDPNYAKAHEAKFVKLSKAIEKVESRASCANPVLVPIAVHFQGVTNPDVACLVTLAQTQIDVINEDISGTNSDISKWTTQAANNFPGVSNGEACVNFCIATKNHPSGYGLSEGSPAVTINKTTGDTDNNWSGYINIFVQPNTGLLGYSPLGGAGNGDGVVVDAAAFGKGSGCGIVSPNAPFNLGRTLTHELGHYLLLDHIWGNGCNVDDDVADTPNQNNEYYGCPGSNSSSCGSTDMHMSYMDYVNDACMYMFSAGQTARMEAYIASNLSNVTSNASNVCGVSNPGGTTGGGSTGGTGGGTTVVCTQPAQATVSNIQATLASMAWTAISDAIQYQLRIRAVGSSAWNTQNTNTPSLTVQNLAANTTFEFQIRTQCVQGWTAYNTIATFSTLEIPNNCDKPNSSNVQVQGSNAATVTWEASSDAIRYRIRYRASGTSNWTATNVTSPSKSLSNLSANTTYQYQVRTLCPSAWTAWTTTKSFTTEVESNNDLSIIVKLTLDAYGSETSWELVDDYGDRVKTFGPFSDGTEGAIKTKTLVLEEGCYTLYLDDSYGDGICCAYGDGSLDILFEGQVVGGSDGRFGYYDEIEFCISEDGVEINAQRKDENNKLNDTKPDPKA